MDTVVTLSLPKVELHKCGNNQRVSFAGTGLIIGWLVRRDDGYGWHNRISRKRSSSACPTLYSALGELIMSVDMAMPFDVSY